MAVQRHSPLPVYNQAKDGNPFAWIVRRARAVREVRQFERDLWRQAQRCERINGAPAEAERA